ncbi:LysM peptidoglycan-binding domain-containing protein, partial [Streptomyces calidiresistens]
MDLVSRSGWGARPFRTPAGATPYGRARLGVKVHYLGSAYSDRPHTQCPGYIRSVQAQHMDGNGWSDIAYSFVVCTHGTVYEGRGLERRNAANGNTSLNDAHYAVCALLGASGLTEPPDAQLHGMRDAIEHCRARGPAGGEISRHADGFATACPGPALTSWVRAGAPRPSSGGPSGFHVVQRGETLSGIARHHGTTWQELHTLNRELIGPDPGRITPGQRLLLPGGTHTVRAGETLSGIATAYPGVTWQQIAQANRIPAPYTIHPGQRLTIPAQRSAPV